MIEDEEVEEQIVGVVGHGILVSLLLDPMHRDER